MGIDFKKLIRWLLPFSWRKIRVQEFIKALFVQIEKLYNSLLSYDKEIKEEAGRTCQTISIEKVLNESFDYPIEIQESDGKPTDFNIIVSGYVNEARLCALVDKYKKAAKSYKINQQGIETVIRFLNHVCEKGDGAMKARFVNHVCEKLGDTLSLRYVNHVCVKAMIVTVYPEPVSFSGSGDGQVQVNITVNTIEDTKGYCGTVEIGYTLYGINGSTQTHLKTGSGKVNLHHVKEGSYTWNRLESFWVKNYNSWKVVLNYINPEFNDSYYFKLKN